VSDVADGSEGHRGIRPQDATMSVARRSGITATVAYFEHLLEFGLAQSTVAGREEGIVVQTPAQDSYGPSRR